MGSFKVKQPLAIALGASIVAHLVLAGWLFWSLVRFVQPTNSPRVLTLEFTASEQDEPRNHEAVADAETARLSERSEAKLALNQQAQEKIRPQKQRPEIAAQFHATSETSNAAEPLESPARAPEIVADTASAPVANDPPDETQSELPLSKTQSVARDTLVQMATPEKITAIVTSGASRTEARPASGGATDRPAILAFSRAEQKMLERQVRRWTSELAERAADAPPLRWTHKGQPYEAYVRHIPARGDTDIEKLAVEVVTEKDGTRLRTQLQMKMLAFSHFAQFVHRWDPEVQIHDDLLDGRFHSNSRITLASDRDVQPRFLGKVTTASSGVTFSGRRGKRDRQTIFSGGLETGVKRIPMGRRKTPAALSAATESQQVVQFDDDAHIRFAPDGSFSWSSDAAQPTDTVTQDGKSIYLVGARGKTLYVSGEVSGSVLVYSPTRIVIEGNLTYAQGALQDTVRQSFLGLVSEGNVEIAEPEIIGPGPLYVHAAIYAGRRFKVRDFRRRDHSRLYIFGSLSAGTLSATEPRYATHIEFDKRLEERRPPGYPVTNRFEVAAWNQGWQPAGGD